MSFGCFLVTSIRERKDSTTHPLFSICASQASESRAYVKIQTNFRTSMRNQKWNNILSCDDEPYQPGAQKLPTVLALKTLGNIQKLMNLRTLQCQIRHCRSLIFRMKRVGMSLFHSTSEGKGSKGAEMEARIGRLGPTKYNSIIWAGPTRT